MNKQIFKRCLKIAVENTTPNNPQWDSFMHFSFYIQKNKIVAYGQNQNANPEIFLGYPKHSKIHSEISGWKKAKYYLKDEPFEVINIRTTKQQKTRLSKPCPCCMTFLQDLNCKRIWYSTEDNFKVIKL